MIFATNGSAQQTISRRASSCHFYDFSAMGMVHLDGQSFGYYYSKEEPSG